MTQTAERVTPLHSEALFIGCELGPDAPGNVQQVKSIYRQEQR